MISLLAVLNIFFARLTTLDDGIAQSHSVCLSTPLVSYRLNGLISKSDLYLPQNDPCSLLMPNFVIVSSSVASLRLVSFGAVADGTDL